MCKTCFVPFKQLYYISNFNKYSDTQVLLRLGNGEFRNIYISLSENSVLIL